jgi:hypothetical protein
MYCICLACFIILNFDCLVDTGDSKCLLLKRIHFRKLKQPVDHFSMNFRYPLSFAAIIFSEHSAKKVTIYD